MCNDSFEYTLFVLITESPLIPFHRYYYSSKTHYSDIHMWSVSNSGIHFFFIFLSFLFSQSASCHHVQWLSNNLEGVPIYAELLLADFPPLCSPTHLNLFKVDDCGGQSDAALHHCLSSPSNGPQIAWRLGHCPVKKQNDGSTKDKPDVMACCSRMLQQLCVL